MDTRKLEALMLAVDMGSFTKAAAALGCTQSGLTHMMDSLEREVGFALLTRGRTGVKLTEKGEQLLPVIREAVKWNNRLQTKIRLMNCKQNETIRVASYSSMSLHWLPQVMKKFQADYPNFNVDVKDGTVDEVFSWVRSGAVDLGFASKQEDTRCDWIPLKNDPLVAILPMEFEVDDTERLPVQFFDRKLFLMPSYGFEKDILRVLENYHVHPVVRASEVDDTVILSMVEHGLGISILSELVIKDLHYHVHTLRLDPEVYRELGIAVQSVKMLEPPVRRFITYARRIIC